MNLECEGCEQLTGVRRVEDGMHWGDYCDDCWDSQCEDAWMAQYEGEPPVSIEERYRQAADQKRRLG